MKCAEDIHRAGECVCSIIINEKKKRLKENK